MATMRSQRIGGLQYTDLSGTPHTPFSAVSGATADGMNALVKFINDGRPKTSAAGDQIGRSVFVKAEDVSFIRQLQVQILGNTQDDLSFVNEKLLPTQLTRDTKIKWNTIQFVPGAMTPNPAFGTNFTHERITTQDEGQADRSGQHFEIEGDAWYTEQGQKDFQMNMAYWSVCLANQLCETAWAEIVRPRLETRRSYFSQSHNFNTFLQAVTKQRDDMFAPYKDPKGIYRLVQEQCEYISVVNGKEANIMVMPREKSALITNGTQISSYGHGGERGLDLLMSKGYLGQIVPGLPVYSPPKFTVNPAMPDIGPLNNEIRIGSYSMVRFAEKDAEGPMGFKKGECLDQLYDENEDRWKPLPHLETCLKSSGRFTETGTLITTGDAVEAAKSDKSDPFRDFYNKPATIPESTFPGWAKWCLDPENRCKFMVVAPFAGYHTQGTLIAAAGEDAGITTMSEPIISKGEDPMTQVFKFNMTVWIGAYIFEPRRFMVSHHVFYNGIIGGGGVSLIDTKEAYKLKNESEWENNTLARQSMYFMVVSADEECFPDFIDLRGNTRFTTTKSYPSAAFYSSHYGWDNIDEGTQEFVRQPIAPICFRREYNRWDGTQYSYTPGDTPHGRIVGVGSREMRRYGRCIVENIITQASRH